MDKNTQITHGTKRGTQKYCAKCRTWSSASNFARGHGRCTPPSSSNTQSTSISKSSCIIVAHQSQMSDGPSLINTQQTQRSEDSSFMNTQQYPSKSRISSTTEEHEAFSTIDDYLLNKFTADGYNRKYDAIPYCPSLDKAKSIFDNCKLYKLTECWIYNGNANHYRTVAEWKCDMNRTFGFPLGN
ncbi:unnamed protein product, partial [Rotaria sp. Silwood1]